MNAVVKPYHYLLIITRNEQFTAMMLPCMLFIGTRRISKNDQQTNNACDWSRHRIYESAQSGDVSYFFHKRAREPSYTLRVDSKWRRFDKEKPFRISWLLRQYFVAMCCL